MTPRLRIPKNLFDAMIAQARAEAPNECCGLLAGPVVEFDYIVVERMPLVNAAATPWNRFESSPESMFAAMKKLRTLGLELLAVYHSHPTGGRSPSALDRDSNYAPDVANIIMDLSKEPPVVTSWRIDNETMIELTMEISN